MQKMDPDFVHGCLADWVTNLGPDPIVQFRTGPEEASISATPNGFVVLDMELPTSPFTSPFAGEIAKTGAWTGAASAAGVIGHARFMTNDLSECHWLGKVSQAVAYALTADALIDTITLSVADTTAVVVGSGVAGIGVQDGTKVLAKGPTSLTLNLPLKATMFDGEAVAVGDVTGDMIISGAFVPNVGYAVTVESWSFGWRDLI